MGTAFVLSGGGSLGPVQVGMLLALAEHGVVPDLIIGASVGAVNAAWLAGRPGLDGALDLAAVWRSVRRDDVFPLHPWRGLLGFVGRRDHLVDPASFRRLLARHLAFEHLEDATVPVRVVATEVATGTEVVLSRGDAVDAVVASTAIPGVFPSVRIEGRDLMDGGISNDTPISHAVEWGATTIYVLPTGYTCELRRPPGSALGMALHAITLLVQRLASEAARDWGPSTCGSSRRCAPSSSPPWTSAAPPSSSTGRTPAPPGGWRRAARRRIPPASSACTATDRARPAGWPRVEVAEGSAPPRQGRPRSGPPRRPGATPAQPAPGWPLRVEQDESDVGEGAGSGNRCASHGGPTPSLTHEGVPPPGTIVAAPGEGAPARAT